MQRAEITGTHRICGHNIIKVLTFPDIRAFEVSEDKRAVLPNRAAESSTVLVAVQRVRAARRAVRRNIEKIAGVHFVVPEEFEDRAVVLIRPALQRSIDHVGGMTVFGGHIGTLDLELLDGVYIGLDQCPAGLHFADQGSVERPTRPSWGRAVNGDIHD